MRIQTRLLAVLDLLLISPAALFMFALLLRNLPLSPSQPPYAAQQIVNFYAGHMWTLWVLLIALPLAALAIGCATLLTGLTGPRELALPGTTLRSPALRNSLAALRSNPATLLVAATTLTSAAILVIVALHMLAN